MTKSVIEVPVQTFDAPVLIVGAGPAGLTSSLALSRYGIPHILVEQYGGMAHTPRAHIVSQRTVEILRHLGIEDRFHAVATHPESMRNTFWVTTLAGKEIARLDAFGTGPDRMAEYLTASPCQMSNCPQTVFEPLLLDAAREAGADIRLNHECTSTVQDDAGVTSTILNRDTGEVFSVRSQFVIGADGVRGKVLSSAGLHVDGDAGLASAANVWFRADLSRYFQDRPGVLVWNVMPGPHSLLRLGTLICHQPFTEFVFVYMYDPMKHSIEEVSHDELIARVRAFVGDDDLDVEILGVAGWKVNAQVAPDYANKRLFCMGDAVHRHPPTNGLGLNLSVADAFNLAWKLAYVLRGQAGAALLESYSAERQPVGAAGVKRAITSLWDLVKIDEALGYTPGQSEQEGWQELALLEAPGPEGEARRDALRNALELQHYCFNAHGVEIGYRYDGNAIAAEPPTQPASALDAELHYTPTTRPGAGLPHARLLKDGVIISSLDLVEGLHFALITAPGGEGWQDAAKLATEVTGITVDVHVIGSGSLHDPHYEWLRQREVDSEGCVLVRPDRHVAWRSEKMPDDPAGELIRVLTEILALPLNA